MTEPLTIEELDVRELVFKIAELVSLSKVELACIHMRAALGQELQSHSRQLWLEAARMRSSLQKIAMSDAECGCNHDTADCCNGVGVFCARCTAAEVLNG